MKKSGVIVLFFCLMLALNCINAGRITGAASSQEQGVAVYVLPSTPLLRIDSPLNQTYAQGQYILFDYTAILMESVWYNLDNNSNTTINSSFYLTPSVGSHTAYLYGNHSNGTIYSDQVTFYVQAAEQPSKKKKVVIEEEIPVTVEKERINISLKQGEEETIRILVKNEYHKKVDVILNRTGLEDILRYISETEFDLEVNEEKEILLTFYASPDLNPDLYLGKLFANTKTSQKEIILAVEVESSKFLFDVVLDIPKEPTVFQRGDEIISKLDFYNLGAGEAEVEIEYLIKNEAGEIVFGEKQILLIGASISLTKAFKLPDNIEDGTYVFYVKANYDGKTASASKWFTISSETGTQKFFKGLLQKTKQFFSDNKVMIAKVIAFLVALYILYGIICLLFGKKRKKKPAKYIASKKKKKRRSTYSRLLRAVTEREHKKAYK